MSDNKKWVKAWTNLLTDPDFQNMRIEDKGRWFTILLLLGEQGRHGSVRFYPPSPMICLLLGVSAFDALKPVLKHLSECNISTALHKDGSLIIKMKNWRKYQVDNSADRVRAWRHQNVTRKKRGEEKRGDVTPFLSEKEPPKWM